MTESEVKRKIRILEALCEIQNNPKQIEQPIPEKKKKIVRKKKKKSVRKKKNNKMTKSQHKAYKKHKELSKKERQKYKEEQLSRNMKKAYFRIRRQYLQECAQWQRQMEIMMRRQMNNATEQTV